MEEVILTESDVPGAYFADDPSKYDVVALKRWLACHGQSRKGLRAELLERVRGCIALKVPVDPKVDKGKWYELKKKGGSLTTAASAAKTSSLAAAFPSDGWSVFPSVDIPEMFNYGNTHHYMIESIADFGLKSEDYAFSSNEDDSDDDSGYTTTETPLRKGRWLIKSGYVVDLQDNQNDKHYFLRAHVHHSMKNEYPLNVSVALSKASGFVIKASCDCRSKALNRCAHVASVLLTLVNHTEEQGHC